MRFHGDDIGIGGSIHRAERYRFRDRDDEKRIFGMRNICKLGDRLNHAKEIRRLHHDARSIVMNQRAHFVEIHLAAGRPANLDNFHAQIFRVRGEYLPIFRMHGFRDHHSFAIGDAIGHQHRFGGGRRAIPHGGVGNILAGKLAHHGLKFENGLQRALADFRLIGSVGSEEFSAQQNCVAHHAAQVVVDSGAKKTGVAERIFFCARL